MNKRHLISPAVTKSFFKIIFSLLGILIIITLGIASFVYFQINRTNGEIISSGTKRSFLLFVPPSYDPNMPIPLVISIHGYAEWPAHQMEITHWNQMASDQNFIVVYPSGTGFPKHWFAGNQDDNLLDVQFIEDLIDHLQQEYKIDNDRIYANGLSNGGGMSFMLACKLSNRIAAFGGVSGAYLLPWEDCNPKRPIPAILFHGTEDPIVPFEGGPSKAFDIPFPDITDWVKNLADQNNCDKKNIEPLHQKDVSEIHYYDCENNADIKFYIITQGGHSWPGGEPLPKFIVGNTTQSIDATALMWEFFKLHPMTD